MMDAIKLERTDITLLTLEILVANFIYITKTHFTVEAGWCTKVWWSHRFCDAGCPGSLFQQW
jgi:hypothetical protein